MTAIDGRVGTTTGPEERDDEIGSRKPDIPELAAILVHRERVGYWPGPDRDRAHRLTVLGLIPDKLSTPAVLMHPREGAGTSQ